MSRSSRTCRRAAEVRWTVDTHPTLIYCRSRQHVLGSLVANLHQYDLAAPEAADAVAHINDLLRVDGGIVTPIYYWMCINTEIAPSHNNQIRKLLDAGAGIEVAKLDGWTPLAVACQYDHNDCARLLLGGQLRILKRHVGGRRFEGSKVPQRKIGK